MKSGVYQLTATVFMVLAANALATVLYVDSSCTNPTPPYTNWITAATNIQDAVDAANAGDQVLVTNGIYQSGGRLVSGDATTNRLVVTNAVTVQSMNGAAVTVIKGYQMLGTTNGNNAIRCVYLATNAVLIGFTLTNGATQSSSPSNGGGGVRAQSLGACISNCVIVGNSAVFGAGALSGTLNNCVLSNNVAQNTGGGAYAMYYSGGQFLNSALNNCLMVGNSATNGGAVGVSVGCNLTLNNCTISGNSASVRGGGGSSLGITGESTLSASNCIIFGNTAPTGPNYAFASASEMSLNYCCTVPLPTSGTGNFTNAPLFVNQSGGDFHLQSTSPCINSGDNTYVLSSTDLDGNPRIVGNYVDMGAYEYQLPAPDPLFPAIQASYMGVSTGTVVAFTGQIAGHPNASRWDFGDGTTISNTLPTVTHAWTMPGDYVVALWAYNDSYPTGVSATVTIHVLARPVHYVAQTSTNPIAPYLSWDTAATVIQDGVDAAYINGTVLVSNGLYSAGGGWITSVYSGWSLSNRVTVWKPLTVQSVNGPAVTTIQGCQVAGTTNGNGAVRCAYLTNNSSLLGFTLTGGATTMYNGTGMDYARVQSGGGVYGESSASVVSNCILTANAAYVAGGGAYSVTLANCLLSGNSAEQGGGATGTTLNNCTLTGNSALSGGGAFGSTGANCVLVDNEVVYDGGGAWGCTLNNCTVVGNAALEAGGGASGCTLNNCVIYNNTSPSGTNYAIDAYVGGSLQYCCTTPLAAGPGNFTNPPAFVDEAGANSRLQPNSPCINAGNNSYVSDTTDLDGNPRIKGGTVDIGAYEYQTPTSIISYAWLQQYGLPTDGSADFLDTDGDGMNNWREWMAGTDPTNPLSVLKMLAPSNSLSGLTVSWQSVSGKTYYLQRGTNLLLQPGLSSLQSNIVGQAGMTSLTDTSATNAGPYFYRVGVQ